MKENLESKPSVMLKTTAELLQMTRQSRAAHFAKLDKNSRSHDPDYPRPVRLSVRCTRYVEQEVIAWIEKKMEERR